MIILDNTLRDFVLSCLSDKIPKKLNNRKITGSIYRQIFQQPLPEAMDNFWVKQWANQKYLRGKPGNDLYIKIIKRLK